ncbi:pentapeptide repeat-containing protein [Actinomadura sp. 6N118]|uniref:pentapeptide repeat-containing protein n=1 Tax=Actinomadura sp. 6N118 TaxID=3375151 RepID=UPI00378CBCB3
MLERRPQERRGGEQAGPDRTRAGAPVSAVRVLAWWAYLLGAVVAAALTGVAIWFLLQEAAGDPKLRIDAIRTGLTVGLGAGGAFALLIQARRQWLQERAHNHQERTDVLAHAHQERLADAADKDAAERRITEKYNTAAEHLGSDKAPVRLTALYTLERLANDNPGYRQTIVSIICAYLRMPFALPTDQEGGPDPVEGQRAAVRRFHTARAAARAGTWPVAPVPAAGAGPHEERQVRLTAQRLLHTHLQPDASVHWPGIHLDLAGATLIDFTLRGCTLAGADFTKATFFGDADFREATFFGDADFTKVAFSRDADFRKATFAHFADFTKVTFPGDADFREATFTGHTSFLAATFSEYVDFERASFSGHTEFKGATFSGPTDFFEATFTEDIDLREATVAGKIDLREATFASVCFGEATFAGEVELENTTVSDTAANHVLPSGWRIEPAANGGHIVAGPTSSGESGVGASR